jgi:integrase/recombinase XerD
MPESQYIIAFEAHLITERRLTYNTIIAYKKDIEQFVQYLKTTSKTVQNTTIADLHGFLQAIYDQRCKARTIARKVASLKTFFSFLAEKYGFTNVAGTLATPKCEATLPRYLSEAEIQKLIEVASAEKGPYALRNRLILLFLYSTGMRISELLGLRTVDVRLDSRTVLVNGKGNKQRIVPIPEELIPILTDYVTALARAYEEATIIMRSTRTPDYLFPSHYGASKKPLSRQAFWQILRKLCARAGINRDVSPHQLRHSLATHLLQRGADLRSLQLLLGHETLSTIHVYTHLDTSNLRDIYNKKHLRS